jgi:hypothetical protein
MNKPTNNVEMLTQFMEHGSPLNQIFVIDAVTKLAKLVVDNEEETLKHMEGGFVNGPAWVKCAKDFLKQSEEFYT